MSLLRSSVSCMCLAAVGLACGGSKNNSVDGGGLPDGGSPDSGATTSDSGTTGTPDGGSTDAGSCLASTGKWVDGYYADYEQSLYPISNIDWCGLTHIMISHAMPNNDGSLNLSPDGVSVTALAASLVPAAHQNGRKALMHIGGADSEPSFNAATTGATANPHTAPFTSFVSNLESLLVTTGADGFDFDWEPLDALSGNVNAAADEAALLALVQQLRNDRPQLILTVSIYWVSGNYALNGEAVDAIYSHLVPYVDQINIQTYQMFYAGQTTAVGGWESWYTSALYYPNPGAGNYSPTPGSVDSSVRAYLGANVPASKLGIGIPFFGECWQNGITAPDQQITSANQVNANDDGVMTYASIATYYYAASAAQYDSNAQAPYLTFTTPPTPPTSTGLPNTCTFITYDDPQSIAAKGAYVKTQGLGGTIVWTINQGYLGLQPNPPPAGQQDPLLQALYTSFLQ